MKTKQRGFSLMEVMLVMTIVAALGTGGILGWQKWQRYQNLWMTQQKVRSFLEQLRSDANWHNRNHLLVVLRSGTRWCLASSHLASDSWCESNTRWKLLQPYPDIDIVNMTAGLGFYGQRNTAWPGHLVLRGEAGEWHIIVSVWGRIRVCEVSETKKCI